MAEVKPFASWRYNPSLIPKPQETVVPPYDVITEAERDEMKRLNKYNFAKIILSEGEEKHKKAAAEFREWQKAGVLIRDEKPGLYFYRQDFILSDDELFCQDVPSKLTRYGFFAVVGLADYKDEIVLPHEKTFAKYKADRYELMEASHGNMEPVFLGYDSNSFTGEEFDKIVAQGKLLYDYKDRFGVQHKLWVVDNEDVIRSLQEDLSSEKLYILDGHHRYETALKYYKDHPSEKTKYVLAQLCAFKQKGTVILPTHRLVQGDLDIEGLERKGFEITKVNSLKDLETRLHRSKNVGFGIRAGRDPQLYFAELRDSWNDLDLDYLHEKILTDPSYKITYVRSISEFHQSMEQGSYQIGFLVRPNTYDDVVQKALHHKVMPHKSTFFYPKIPSGLVVHRFE